MQYQSINRWVLIAIMLIMSGIYFYDIHPRLLHWFSLRSTVEDLVSQDHQIIAMIHQHHRVPVKQTHAVQSCQLDCLLHRLTIWVEMSGLQLMLLELNQAKMHDAWQVKMKVQGTYQQWLRWIRQMQQRGSLFHFSQFEIHQVSREQLVFKMQFQLFITNAVSSNVLSSNAVTFRNGEEGAHLFCTEENKAGFFKQQSDDALHRVSIHSMKMVGLIAQGARRYALMWLPNHRIIMVKQGIRIGQERAVMIQITPARSCAQLAHSSQLYCWKSQEI